MKINKKYRLENIYQSFGLLLFFMINTEDYTEDFLFYVNQFIAIIFCHKEITTPTFT